MNTRNIVILLISLAMSTWSCEEYLDKVEASDVTNEDIFGTYTDFQRFADEMYGEVIPYMKHANNSSYNYGDHMLANASGMPSGYMDNGDYWQVWTNVKKTIFHEDNGDHYEGIWDSSWRGIRIANICLENMEYLVEATEEQRNFIMGQAYFFRGFFHWEIIRAFGGMPYIDELLSPNDLRRSRLSYQECTEHIVEDMDMAIALLPADWDNTVTGEATEGANRGRATKGAALAVKSKALLFAGSPLMNNESTGSGYVFDNALMERAAEAAHQFINLVNDGTYALESIDTYSDNFYRMDGTTIWGDEIIWARTMVWNKWGYPGWKNQGIGRLHAGGRLGNVQNCEAPTENLVELFEDSTGLPIDDPESVFDPTDPWTGRDPRFYKSVLTDGTYWRRLPDTDPEAYIQTYLGGGDQGTQGTLTGYLAKKYWPFGINTIDGGYGNYWTRCPILRVADIYLIYAEAMNEAYGPTTAPNFNGETGLTAVEAVNIVRARAGLPGVHSKFTGDKESFRERVRNERAVELCFEGHRWHDIRRWHVAHLPEYKIMYALHFDKDHTYFKKEPMQTRVFDEKHYWLPLPLDQVQLYEEFYQNPGW